MNALYQAASRFWLRYLDRGPGVLQPIDLEEFEEAKSECSLSSSREFSQLGLVIDELESLFRRCVERSEGLCFVTGEAGLIPDQNLHDRCELLLERIRSAGHSTR